MINKPHADAYRMAPDNDQHITKEKLLRLLPKNTTVAVTDEILKLIANMGKDVDLPQDLLEEDLVSHIHLLGKQSGAGVKDLVNAIKYCNLKLNYDNKTAWSLVFPNRYKKLIDENRQVDSHVSMYNNKNKLVQAIEKAMVIPVHLQYAPYFHAAVKKQYELLNGIAGTNADGEDMTVSPMVMHLAAKELALLTKQPEEATINLKVSQSDAMIEAQNETALQLQRLVDSQAVQFANGGDISQIQKLHVTHDESSVIDAEITQ